MGVIDLTQKDKDIEYILDGLEKLGFDLNDVESVRSFIQSILSQKPFDDALDVLPIFNR